VLAFVIFTSIAWLATPFVGVRFFDVQESSPAAEAGLVAGDAIVAIDGRRYEFFGASSILDGLRASAGQHVTLTVDHRDGTRSEVPVTLRPPEQINETQGALGISSSSDAPFQTDFFGEYTGRDLPAAIAVGASETGRAFGLIANGLGALVGSVAENPTAAPPVAGPVGIAVQIGDTFWNAGPILTLYVVGILSANLALVNVLPFPPLDGGRMLVIVLKRIFGTRISLRAEQLTYLVGFIFLFAFIIWITGFDIMRILGGAGS
jgi:regulator of sigma E protease